MTTVRSLIYLEKTFDKIYYKSASLLNNTLHTKTNKNSTHNTENSIASQVAYFVLLLVSVFNVIFRVFCLSSSSLDSRCLPDSYIFCLYSRMLNFPFLSLFLTLSLLRLFHIFSTIAVKMIIFSISILSLSVNRSIIITTRLASIITQR